MGTGGVPAGTTSLFYVESGEGPAVLFLHAGVADSRMWQPQFDAIDGYRMVAFDRRGFGQTPLGTERFSDKDDALSVMNHLDLDQVVAVGCSMGCAVALALASDHPERVRGLVLIGADAPGFQPESTWEPPEWPLAVESFETGDLERAARLEAEVWLAGKDRTLDDVDPEVVDLFCDMDLIALRNETARDELRVASKIEQLPDPAPPSLLIVGKHDLPDIIEAAHHMAGRLSDQPAVVLAGTAHLPSMEVPDRFNTVLSEFLRSL